MMLAASHLKSETLKVLIENGSDIHVRNSLGSTILAWAAERGEIGIIEELLARGAHINETATNGWTLVLKASHGDQTDTVRFLIERGADPNLGAIGTGWTPLMEASFRGHVATVKALVEGGVDVNATNSEGQTALKYAGMSVNKTEIVALLERNPSAAATPR